MSVPAGHTYCEPARPFIAAEQQAPKLTAQHIHDEVLPYAREHGVTEEQIAAMLTANPRRLFEQPR